MFVDMQGYTSLTSGQTREEHQWFIKEINSFIHKHAENKHGNLVKTMGDGFLITFESPTDAITCGIAIQEEIKRRNANVLNENHWLRLRVGISTGEVSVTEQNDVYGEAVNIAARIEKFCEPNEIFISESTYLAMNKSEIKTQDLGPLKFKNVSDDIRVFKVLKDKVPSSSFEKPSKFSRLIPVIFAMVFAVILVIAGLRVYRLFHPRQAAEMKEPQPFERNWDEACRGDMQQFCAQVQHGGGRILRCLMERFEQVGAECRDALARMRDHREISQERFQNFMPEQNRDFEGSISSSNAVMSQGSDQRPSHSFRENCQEDIQNYCSGIQPGGGRLMRCLAEHRNQISQACSQSLGSGSMSVSPRQG